MKRLRQIDYKFHRRMIKRVKFKAVANGLVGQVLAGPLFLKVKTKFHFTKSK